MATTSPDNLRTPNPGDPYNLVSDLAVFANDVQGALTKRANSHIGTTAQMNALAAPDGSTWFNTTNNGEYVRLSGAWVLSGFDGTASPGSGYTMGNIAIGMSNRLVTIAGSVAKTAAGSPSNQSFLTNISTLLRPEATTFAGLLRTGSGGTGMMTISTSGTAIVNQWNGPDMAAGQHLSFSGAYRP